MEPGFFRSREFFVALAVGVLILAGAAWAFGPLGGSYVSYASGDAGCEPREPEGDLLSATASVEETGDLSRTVRYSMDPLGGGLVSACSGFGEVALRPSPDALVHVVFKLDGSGTSREALDETVVEASFHRRADGLGVAAWVGSVGVEGARRGHRSVTVTVEVLVPADGAYDARLTSGFGLVAAENVLVRDLEAVTSFGEVRLSQVAVEGNLSARSGHGAVHVALSGATGPRVEAASDFGAVDVRLPQRADVGYDVTGASDFGDVTVSVGPVETYEDDDEGMGERVHVRTVGYASKPTRVVVEGASGHGVVTILAEASEGGNAR